MAQVNQTAIGAAWLRLWRDEERGFGYINADTPELSMAVLPSHRNQGVGTRLLLQVLDMARAEFSAISLNVRANNQTWPAIADWATCLGEPLAILAMLQF